jgi:hypothetical protein
MRTEGILYPVHMDYSPHRTLRAGRDDCPDARAAGDLIGAVRTFAVALPRGTQPALQKTIWAGCTLNLDPAVDRFVLHARL